VNLISDSSASRAFAQGPSRRALLALAVVVLLCIAGATAYIAVVIERRDAAAASTTLPAPRPIAHLPAAGAGRPYLLFRSTVPGDTYGRIGLAYADAPGESRDVGPLRCERVYYASGRGICLEAQRGVVTRYRALIFDDGFQVLQAHELAGPPSRARVAHDGRRAAVTVFVSGHSYASPGFSTRTSVIDTEHGTLLADDLEHFEALRDGAAIRAADLNLWGVTFARNDDDRFYATLATGGHTFLVEGDLATRRLQVVLDDVECPSLSPDGRRIAFKRRLPMGDDGRLVWGVHVLDLTSRQVTWLKVETRSIDDQIEWLGNDELAYAMPDDNDTPGGLANASIWRLAADGSSPPQRLLRAASSPALVP